MADLESLLKRTRIAPLAAAISIISCTYEMKEATVTATGIAEVCDGETGYCEMQNTITIDKHNVCLRGSDVSKLEVGDTVSRLKFRYGIFGPCDYLLGYKKENK